MKRIIIVFNLIVLLTVAAYASPTDSLWMQGNQAYTQGDYALASEKYESILKLGVESTDVYFNLGNAYYKQNMLGQSILNYERALKLSPENADVVHNLEMARLLQLDKIEPIPEFILAKWYKSIIQILSASAWGILSVVLFATFLVLLLVYFFTKNYGVRKLSFFINLLVLILFVASIVFASQQRSNLLDNSQAIIFAPVVTVKGSPDVNGTDLFIIHEGLKVKVIDQIGSWYRVTLTDGNQGWIPADTIERI